MEEDPLKGTEDPLKGTKEAVLEKLIIAFLAVTYIYIFVKMMFL